MARWKVLGDNPREIKVSVEKELYEELGRLSEKTGMSVSRLSRNLIMSGLEDIQILETAGLLTLAIKWRDYREKLHGVRDRAAELDGSVCFT